MRREYPNHIKPYNSSHSSHEGHRVYRIFSAVQLHLDSLQDNKPLTQRSEARSLFILLLVELAREETQQIVAVGDAQVTHLLACEVLLQLRCLQFRVCKVSNVTHILLMYRQLTSHAVMLLISRQ
jgi:hypothetical protein